MRTSAPADDLLAEVDSLLAPVDAQAALYPGEPATRQPVHTVYVPADRFHAGTPHRWGEAALELLDEHETALAAAVALPPETLGDVVHRVRTKLATQPVEDLRVDFEDGYGTRPDPEEDAAALAAGAALTGFGAGGPFLVGLRVKGLQPATRRRALRTLDLLVGAAAGAFPDRFVVTLPKVTHPGEVAAGVLVARRLEQVHGLAEGAIRLELQVELPQAVLGPDGAATVARLVHTGAGRLEGMHYGTYDFSAAMGVVAAEQSPDHPLAEHAKAVMQLAAAQTGVRVSDGSTNVVPVGSRAEIAHAWQLHARLVRRALRGALYQGWDLHPGHLVTRYAATYAFHRDGLAPGAARLRDYSRRAVAGTLDEPATAQALSLALLRGIDCGAVDLAEVTLATGWDRESLGRFARREDGS